ncbi:MAG TPA: protein translocase subunit SecF [Thermoanaerobaculia bacterium]|nr:protein translocase subunit SecF [Thermoanaerobaculia bacterium]
MELLRNTNIDFMKYRKFWIAVSFILVLAGVAAIIGGIIGKFTINFGIDFAGGTQMTLRFRQKPQTDQLRQLLEGAGLGDASVQSIGERGSNDIMIKTPVAKGSEEGSRQRIEGALSRSYNQGVAGKPDLNRIDAGEIAALLARSDPDHVRAQGDAAAAAHYKAAADALIKERHKEGIFIGWDRLRSAAGVSPAVTAALSEQATIGDYAVLGVENVGPQIGSELRAQGFWAVALSLLGMLAYIWFRFELRFGIGAVMAGLHDVLVTFAFFVLSGYEFNLTTVAAFLTLIGYSMNDTVVIFDRIRENMRKNRRKPLIETMNESINQTLSRTIMTSGLTMLTVASLLVLGGDVLRGFALVMTIGIIVGTYSSIYVASPFALLWEHYFGKGKDTRASGGSPPPPPREREKGERQRTQSEARAARR